MGSGEKEAARQGRTRVERKGLVALTVPESQLLTAFASMDTPNFLSCGSQRLARSSSQGSGMSTLLHLRNPSGSRPPSPCMEAAKLPHGQAPSNPWASSHMLSSGSRTKH